MPSKKYIELTRGCTRAQATILFRLRTGYIPLNEYLDPINARKGGPACEACKTDAISEEETVHHLLLDCPAYERARSRLRAELGVRRAGDIQFLLHNHRACDALMHFLDRTGRFTDSLGMLVVPPPPEPAGVLRYIEGPILPIARGDRGRAA
jgi:hypothetical protein